MNNNSKNTTIYIAKGAMIAALYVVVSLVFSPLSYGPIQVRFAEALVPLCALSPVASVGLVVGCFITNLFSPYGLVDIVFGTLGTLISVLIGYRLRKIRLLGFPIATAMTAVIANALILGPVLCYFDLGRFDLMIASIIALQIAVGQLVSCTLLALPIFKFVEKHRFFSLSKEE